MLKRSTAQCIANLTAKHLGLKCRPVVSFVKRLRGMAYMAENRIELPEGIRTRHSIYSTYYIAHEICHFFNGGIHHGRQFRKVEDKALKFWNISIKRKGAYPIDIRSI